MTMGAVVTCREGVVTTSAATSCRQKRVWMLLFVGFISDLSCLHASRPEKSHQKGLEPSDLEKSRSEAVVLPWKREIIVCVFSTTPRSVQIPIQVSISTWDTTDLGTGVRTEAPVVQTHRHKVSVRSK